MDDHTGGSGDAAADGPAGPAGPDPFDVVFDEDFVRAARTKEPSARARMLTERFKQLEAEQAAQVRAAAAAAAAAETEAGAAAPTESRERNYLWPRNLLIACLAGLMAVALIGLPRLRATDENSNAASSPASKVAIVAAPPDTGAPVPPTSAAAEGVLTGAITTAIAFPDSSVTLEPNLVLERVATAKQIPCDTFASQQMSDLIDEGSGCAQLITALYTTSDNKAQFTIDVLTMNQPEDAATIYGLAKSMSMTYQMGSMDPPAGSLVPTVPAGNAGVTDCVMAVRSLVFVNAQWLDPADQDATTLTTDSDSLLHYVDTKVSTYESDHPTS